MDITRCCQTIFFNSTFQPGLYLRITYGVHQNNVGLGFSPVVEGLLITGDPKLQSRF